VTCDAAQAALSVVADGEDGPERAALDEVDAHLETCPACQAFRHDLAELRQLLRFEPVDESPDVAPAVLAGLVERKAAGRRSRAPAWLSIAAAVAVGAVAGALFVGVGRRPPTLAAAEVPTRVVEAQHGTTSLRARVEVVEVGAVPGEPPRRLEGTLAYRAPESLAVTLDGDGRHLALVVDRGTWWSTGPRRCAPPARATCVPTGTSRAVIDREPFADGAAVPLDVVAPVDSFALSATPSSLGLRRVDGREALGLVVTASQMAPVIRGFDPTGALREVHPADPTEVWLDVDHLVPLAVTIRAGATTDRTRWAAARGYRDDSGAVILAIELTDVRVNGMVPDAAFPPVPAGVAVDGGGFQASDDAAVPTPAFLPVGLRPHRAGNVRSAAGPEIAVRSWSDGRAWLAVRVARSWAGPGLFGDLGPAVRPVALGPAGVAYASDDGSRVALHTDDADVVVTGSLPPSDLVRVAATLGLHGEPVPRDWPEAALATVDEVAALAPGVLVPPERGGFGPPSARVDGATVTFAAAGAGDRSFQLASSPGATLSPPLDPGALAVEVRGFTGRFSPERGDLEWVEEGRVYSLRSATLGLGELVALAGTLEP
jgi:hypothetical protein